MYLTHYVFVSWFAYALLGAQLPGLAKGMLVFVAAALASWGATRALRQVPLVARVV